MEQLGFHANIRGEYEQAKHYYRRGIAISKEYGMLWRLGGTLNVLGEVHRALGEYFALHNLGNIACTEKKYVEAKFQRPSHPRATLSCASSHHQPCRSSWRRRLAVPRRISLAHRDVLFLDESPEFGARNLIHDSTCFIHLTILDLNLF